MSWQWLGCEMSVNLSAIIDAMLAAGCTAEQLAAVVKAQEAERERIADEKRARDAERQRRHRLSRNVTVTSVMSQDETVTPFPSPEVFPRTPFPNPNPNPEIPSKKEPKGSQKGSPFEALSAVLRVETARAVVEHRQRIRKPLTAHAAELLARKFAQCPDPNAAADAMVVNGWQGFDPSWLNRPNARGSPPSKPTYTDAANEIIEEIRRNERAQNQGPERDAERLPCGPRRPEASIEYLPPPRSRVV